MRPLLFVDIDGVLNPYGGPCPEGYAEHWLFPQDAEPVRVCPDHAAWLHELAESFEFMWGSSWTVEDRALLTTVLPLPHFAGAVELPRGQFDPALKVPAIERAAHGRPLAWLDDLLTPEAWAWAETRPAPTLLIPVDPALGLTRQHVDRLQTWASALVSTWENSPPHHVSFMAHGAGHAMASVKGAAAMAHKHDLHVMPHDDGWKIVAPDQDEPLATTRTQEEAIHLATQMQQDRSPREGGEVLIHGRDGRIRERNTINRKDPFPPRG